MKLICKSSLLILSVLSASVMAIPVMEPIMAYAKSVNYIPNDLKRYQDTRICVSCDLSRAVLRFNYEMTHSSLKGSLLTESYFEGNFDDSDFSGTMMAKASTIQQSTGANFVSFRNSNFEKANLMLANIENVDFSGSNFKDAILTNANFSGSNMTSIDFTGANFSGADLRDTNLSGSIISDEQLSKVKTICDAVMPDGTLGAC